MKKLISLIIVGFLTIGSFGAIVIGHDDVVKEKKQTIKVSKLTFLESNYYCSIMLNEADTYLKNPGQPILPVILRTYIFPIGTLISEVSCLPSNINQQYIEKEILYAGKPVPRHTVNEKNIIANKDSSVYLSENFYPDSWYDYNIGIGLKGKAHVAYLTIQIYPVRYSPKNNEIWFANTIDISIKYELPSSTNTVLDEYDLVIITPQIFKANLEMLVNHKESMGIKTNIVTTQEIFSDYEGFDKPEQIKYFIKHAVEEWGVSYILLFGGMKGQNIFSWYMPIRYSHLDDASNFEDQYISDLYYADLYKYDGSTGYIFDDWDSNGNGVFAEWNTDSKDVLDMYPDVYVGRLPCRYRFEVKNIVDRIIRYETNTKDQTWFNKIAVVAGDSFDDINWPTPTDFLEGQEETDLALSYMDDFEHTRIYVEDGDVNFTPENAIDTLSQGHGFVYFSGHGNPMSWATHPHGDFGTWIDFGMIHIKKLSNGEKRPILVVGGCHNCQFDTSLLRLITEGTWAFMLGEMTPICWGWLFASLPKGGSIASIGNTGLGYGTIGDGPDPPDEIPDSIPDGIPDCIQYLGGWIEPHFFEVYNHQDIDILGEVHSKTLIDYINQFPVDWDMDWEHHEQSATLVDCKTVQQWVLFGDPSLKIGGY